MTTHDKTAGKGAEWRSLALQFSDALQAARSDQPAAPTPTEPVGVTEGERTWR